MVIPFRVVVSALVLTACDDGGGTEVTLKNVSSSLANCSGRTQSSATFDISNTGSTDIALVGIRFESPKASGDLDFLPNLTVPAGERRSYSCKGGLGGAAENATVPITATLHYTVGGSAGTATATGQHTTTLLFDFCDTGIPDTSTTPCAQVIPRKARR